MPRRADDLAIGEQVTYRGQRTTVLGAPETIADLFGRPTLRVWARREDTGAEGWILYGPDTAPTMAEMIDEDGSHNVACECPQCEEATAEPFASRLSAVASATGAPLAKVAAWNAYRGERGGLLVGDTPEEDADRFRQWIDDGAHS